MIVNLLSNQAIFTKQAHELINNLTITFDNLFFAEFFIATTYILEFEINCSIFVLTFIINEAVVILSLVFKSIIGSTNINSFF